MKRDSILHTLLVATGVALFCSLLVATTAVYLRPVQLAWQELERNRVILGLAGMLPPAEASDLAIAQRFRELEVLLVALETGAIDQRHDPLTYDPRAAATLAGQGVEIPAPLDLGQLGSRAPLAPVYLSLQDGSPRVIVLPFWGQGMWAPVHGYLALEEDCNTVAGIAFLEHGETPGIGDRIQSAGWRTSWVGRQAIGQQGVMLAARGSGRLSGIEEARYAFDAITGATVTVTAVTQMVRYWLGPHGFGPFLARCRAGEAWPP